MLSRQYLQEYQTCETLRLSGTKIKFICFRHSKLGERKTAKLRDNPNPERRTCVGDYEIYLGRQRQDVYRVALGNCEGIEQKVKKKKKD